ncbi:MAG: PLP-dependent aminotransferase family protein [Rhodospirillaceae bacterium]|nr:PLP-dependent aminotransferase family protein [Rhodospirillaceae bacterium]
MSKTSVTGALIALDIDRSLDVPIYLQIVQRLREAIRAGQLAAGLKLPSTRILARELGVSRNTVLRVFEMLTGEGVLFGHVGSGTFVARAGDDAQVPPPPPDGTKDRYPFRSLSHHGSALIATATGVFSERPIPFMPDLPDLREFPIRTWLRLLNETSGRLTGQILADSPNAGYEPLRRAVAHYLNASRQMVCSYKQVIITTGSQQSLDLVCRLLIDPGDPVWLEEPGYVGAQALVSANGGVIHSIPVDDEGILVQEALETRPAPRLIYISASRHYPLGPTLSMRRRAEILQLSRNCGAWIVEDDYDHEFRYAGASPPALFGLDGEGRTIHIGTFSKTLLPSFRLGYVVVPEDFADAFAKARAIIDRHASLIEQMVLSEFMHRGLFAAHIRRMRGLYRARQQHLIAGLRDLYGPDLVVGATDTGMHVLVPLTAAADDRGIALRMAQAGVMARPLSPYYAGPTRSRGLLFGFAAFTGGEIAQGLSRLSRLSGEIGPLVVRSPG